MPDDLTPSAAPAGARALAFSCHFCGAGEAWEMADLGRQPLANSYLKDAAAIAREKAYPLHARVCAQCHLAQVDKVVPAEDIFSDYQYFSSFSSSWVEHARRHAEQMIAGYGLGPSSMVVEAASNDGYLLRHFVERGVPVLGIEPARNIAEIANAEGVRTVSRFLGEATAREMVAEGFAADLVAANNVLAHVPDINDFIRGLKTLLKPSGVLTVEFHHLLSLISKRQFDAIYHEHFSYLSLEVTRRMFERHGLTVFDVEELTTHGGSLRVYAHRADGPPRPQGPGLEAVASKEAEAGLGTEACYRGFDAEVRRIRRELLEFLRTQKNRGKRVVAYGAAAKGNTLLNYAGVGPDLIAYVVDKSPHKQGYLLPGSHIPIVGPERLPQTKPDFVLVLPWNLSDEIAAEHAYIGEWGGRFAVAVPGLRLLS
jgi:SAM-dependent methyltransferase